MAGNAFCKLQTGVEGILFENFNGPGEMADADFGCVGGTPDNINLYVGKTAVKFNIPEAEAVDRLVDLIQEHGKWAEPGAKATGGQGALSPTRREGLRRPVASRI